MELITQPCLLCDTPVEVDREDWEVEEAPFVLCASCEAPVLRGLIPWPQVQMVYVLRCQVANLYSRAEIVDRHITKLYAAQKELEQEFLKFSKPEPKREQVQG